MKLIEPEHVHYVCISFIDFIYFFNLLKISTAVDNIKRITIHIYNSTAAQAIIYQDQNDKRLYRYYIYICLT